MAYTQDWHPEHTPHFAQDGGIWPVHCVGDSWGAQLHDDLTALDGAPRVRKGVGGEDGYSGFTVHDVERDEDAPTELEGLLRDRGVERVVVVGLATDYCVRDTALDAARLGFETTVLDERDPRREPRTRRRRAGHPGHAPGGRDHRVTSLHDREAAAGVDLALFTDLYELTMLQSYWQHDMRAPATFELFARTLPDGTQLLAGVRPRLGAHVPRTPRVRGRVARGAGACRLSGRASSIGSASCGSPATCGRCWRARPRSGTSRS